MDFHFKKITRTFRYLAFNLSKAGTTWWVGRPETSINLRVGNLSTRVPKRKRMLALVAAVMLTGQAQAFPVEAIGAFFTKLFKTGAATKEAPVAGHTAEGAIGAKGLGHINDVRALQAGEPKPDMAADVIAKSRPDKDSYMVLRASADKGDAAAMLKMSEWTASGRVTDPGEPWLGYWMFQAARLGSQAAARKSREECSIQEGRRSTDRWFDSACSSGDGRILYVRDTQPGSRQ